MTVTLRSYLDERIDKLAAKLPEHVARKNYIRESKLPGYRRELMQEEGRHAATLGAMNALRELRENIDSGEVGVKP